MCLKKKFSAPRPLHLGHGVRLVEVGLAAVAVDEVEHEQMQLPHLHKLGLQSVPEIFFTIFKLINILKLPRELKLFKMHKIFLILR